MHSHRALADDVEDAYTRLRQGGMEPSEQLAIRDAFDEAGERLRGMQEAFVRGEPYAPDGVITMNVQNQRALVEHQRDVLREQYVGAVGGRRDAVPSEIEQLIDLEITRRNAASAQNLTSGAETPAEIADRALRARRDAHQARADAGQLKNPDETIESRPLRIDGIPTDAAIRLDDALQPELERMHHQTSSMEELRASLPDLEERARQFVRDNPSLISEEDALGYVRRRHAEFIEDSDAAYVALEAGGHARYRLMPEEFDEGTFDDAVAEAINDQVYEVDFADAYAVRNASLDTSIVRERVLARFRDANPRQRARLEAELESLESRHGRFFDEDVAERRREYLDENPDSEPPSSSEPPPSSDGGYGGDTTDAGLPDRFDLREAGLMVVNVNNERGIENVFGRDLSLDEVRGIFSLDHLKKYADESDNSRDFLDTTLEVNRYSVEFTGKVGRDFAVQVTYRRGADGLEIFYNFLHIPQALEGTGAAKALITDMVKPLEDLGASEVTLSTAWVGQYAWPKLGARPDRASELAAFDSFERALGKAIEPGMRDQAVRHVMGKIDNIRDLADTWLPIDLVKDRLPELRMGWDDLMRQYAGSNVRQIPFEEACFRTSRSGNEQFLAGKYFLLTHSGPWNSGLSLRIEPGAPWYEEFKGRLGMAGVGAIGLGLWELMGAFSGTQASAHGAGNATGENIDAQLPPEVLAYAEKQRARAEQVESVRERLGYVATQSRTTVETAARSLGSRVGRDRTVEVVPGVTNSHGIKSFLGSNGTLREAYDEKRELLERLSRDPMALVDELTEGLAELEDTAPDLHQQMVAQTYKIAQFLQGKLPATIGASLARPNGAPPNDLALRQFALYYSAATEPGSVLVDLANNRARREQVDTLREVWEPAYNDLKTKLAAVMATGRPTVAQRQRIDLLFDFGDALDTGLSSRLMTLAHQIGDAGDKPPQGAPGKVPGRRTQPSVAGASATASLAQGAAAPRA